MTRRRKSGRAASPGAARPVAAKKSRLASRARATPKRAARGRAAGVRRPLWQCPRCGHWFVSRNLWHSCERISVASHFTGRDPNLRRLWRALVAAARENGPVRISPNRTRIAIMADMRFCGAQVRKDHLRCAFIVTRRIEDPRIVRYEFLAPVYHLHYFPLREPGDLDATVRGWIAEAYRVGIREHVRVRGPKSR